MYCIVFKKFIITQVTEERAREPDTEESSDGQSDLNAEEDTASDSDAERGDNNDDNKPIVGDEHNANNEANGSNDSCIEDKAKNGKVRSEKQISDVYRTVLPTPATDQPEMKKDKTVTCNRPIQTRVDKRICKQVRLRSACIFVRLIGPLQRIYWAHSTYHCFIEVWKTFLNYHHLLSELPLWLSLSGSN